MSPFLAVASVGLLVAVGLAYDVGGTQITAQQQAHAYAAEAARTAGQAINAGATIEGGKPTINRAAAIAAARDYLKTAGSTSGGTARVSGQVRFVNSTTLTVDVTVTESTTFLSIIGIDQVSATGQATARLRHGVTAEDSP